MREAEIGRTEVQADLGKKQDPISKVARAERAGIMAQAVECLPHPEFSITKKETESKSPKIQRLKEQQS
jgi:hypothetical protein